MYLFEERNFAHNNASLHWSEKIEGLDGEAKNGNRSVIYLFLMDRTITEEKSHFLTDHLSSSP